LELAAIHRPCLERTRRARGRLEPALLADNPGDLPQLQSPSRASSRARDPMDTSARTRAPRGSQSVILVDLLLAVGRRAPGTSTALAHARAAVMSSRPLSFPTWQRLWTGILGALVVSLVFFPIYVGGSMTTGVLSQRLHLYAAFELALPFLPAMI